MNLTTPALDNSLAGLKPYSITLASSELAPNMFGASSELASVWNLTFIVTLSRSISKTVRQGLRSQKENVANVVDVTSSEGFLVK